MDTPTPTGTAANTTFLPLAVEEVARLLPIAAEGLGWDVRDPAAVGEGRFRVEVNGRYHSEDLPVVVSLARQARDWTQLALSGPTDTVVERRRRLVHNVMLLALETRLRIASRGTR